jgi:hypothetical protein
VSRPALPPPPPAWHSQDSSSGSPCPCGATTQTRASGWKVPLPTTRQMQQVLGWAAAATGGAGSWLILPKLALHLTVAGIHALPAQALHGDVTKDTPRHLKSHRGPVLLHMSAACTCLLACTMHAPSGRTPLLLHQHDTLAGNDGSNCHGSCGSTTAHTMAARGSPPAAHTRRRLFACASPED